MRAAPVGRIHALQNRSASLIMKIITALIRQDRSLRI